MNKDDQPWRGIDLTKNMYTSFLSLTSTFLRFFLSSFYHKNTFFLFQSVPLCFLLLIFLKLFGLLLLKIVIVVPGIAQLFFLWRYTYFRITQNCLHDHPLNQAGHHLLKLNSLSFSHVISRCSFHTDLATQGR